MALNATLQVTAHHRHWYYRCLGLTRARRWGLFCSVLLNGCVAKRGKESTTTSTPPPVVRLSRPPERRHREECRPPRISAAAVYLRRRWAPLHGLLAPLYLLHRSPDTLGRWNTVTAWRLSWPPWPTAACFCEIRPLPPILSRWWAAHPGSLVLLLYFLASAEPLATWSAGDPVGQAAVSPCPSSRSKRKNMLVVFH
jgi:hypothetical protein